MILYMKKEIKGFKLQRHQKHISEKVIRKNIKKMIFNHSMGTGKTITILNIIKNIGGKFIVILPQNIIGQWK